MLVLPFPTLLMQSRSIAACGQALVTKHNKLIQARYALSLQEKRLVLWLVSAIRPGDTDFHSYRVSVRALAELLGVEKNKNIYAQVAATTRRLMRRVIEIETLDEKCFLQIHWLSSAEYHLGQGCVDRNRPHWAAFLRWTVSARVRR